MTMEPNRPARILCIDDEPIVRETIERALSTNYKVLALPSGEKLSDTLEPFKPDLIILDVRMPQEDGWQLCRRLRQEKQLDAIPIIFLSALSEEADRLRGFMSGGDFYLPKPLDIRELARIIDVFLGRKHRYPEEPS
ncbi:MAG: response regulator [Elusimicrobiota bacterium]|jgi:two-component system OmpR family response regulator